MPRRIFPLLLALMFFVIPMASSGPPYEFYETVSLDDTGHTSTFVDATTSTAFKATQILVRNRAASANTIYLTAATYTVTSISTAMPLAPGEWTVIPPVESIVEPGRASIGLMCATGKTATVDVWGLR